MVWWHSQEEERWQGPCKTRAESIDEGRGEYLNETFMVCEAEQDEYDLRLSARWLLEELNNRNEEKIDPDGDGIFYPTTNEQDNDLEHMVEAAIRAWAEKHKISLRAWSFKNQGPIENIETAPEADDGEPIE